MKVYLRGALLRAKRSTRIMQITSVYAVGTDVRYELTPLRRGRVITVPHGAIDRFYTPIGMGLIEPENSHPSLGTEEDEGALEET
jgi:hypothetical protein